MGFKSIELQVAIPRSQDAGKMQEQGMRQGQQFQETLTQQQLREQIVSRTKVNEFEQVQNRNIADDDDDNSQEEQRQKKQSKTKQIKTEKVDHPYLGTKIDYSG